MKRALVFLAALMMMLAQGQALANAEAATPDVLKVGHTTRLNGNFFSDLWGNNTADLDVRSLLHEYPLVTWTRGSDYRLNSTVISAITKQTADNQDVTYVITLKPGLKYSDGSPITARDYVFTFLLLSSPVIRELTTITAQFDYLVGFEDYDKGVTPYFSGIRLLGELQFSATIKASYLPYFYELSYINSYPLPIQVLAPGCEVRDEGEGALIQGGMDARMLRESILNEQTGYMSFPRVTSGPYRLVAYDSQHHVADFEINPYYLGNYEGQIPSIPSLQFREMKNQELLKELVDGKLDLANKVSDGEVIDEGLLLAERGLIHASGYPRTGSGFLAIACERLVTSSQAVRQALAHSLDPAVLPRDFLKNHGEKIYGYYGLGQWMPPQMEAELATLPRYDFDLDAADRLLTQDGWVYNRQGGAWKRGDPGLRYRDNKGQLEPFSLSMVVTEGNKAGFMVLGMLQDSLSQIGGEVRETVLPLDDAFRQYYRLEERTFDLLFMGTNFTYLFDPTFTYHTDDAYQGPANTSGLRDGLLATLAADMGKVPMGDRDGFLARWFAFQQRWAEMLPMIPLYSNTYYDLFTPSLEGYHPGLYWNWGTAILYAKLKR